MFQSFDPPRGGGGEIPARLAALRALMTEAGVHALIVPHSDEYQGEYLPPCAERLAFVTGFTGSAGLAVVLADRAVLFVDGRYTLQAATEVDGTLFEIVDVTANKPSEWLAGAVGEGAAVGYDPALHTRAEVRRFAAALEKAGALLVPVPDNPVDRVWGDRPAPPSGPVEAHPVEHAGKAAAEKILAAKAAIAAAGADMAVVTATDNVAWLFNVRGCDVAHTPVVLARAVVRADGRATLYVAPDRVPAAVREGLGATAEIAPPEDLPAALRAAGAEGARILADPAEAPEAVLAAVEAAGGTIVEGKDPITAMKAVKNPVEIAGARAAHLRDGVAFARFLAWLEAAAPAGDLDEIAVAERLEAFRRDTGLLREIAFDSIVGAGPNGAIVHYRVNRETSRPVAAGDLLLVDSGGQYADGTTDITRTIAVGPPTTEMAARFTRVLKGHIAIATARFPKGTTGAQLDALARIDLWRAGLDFDHGTGHGVGSYLSVHEGPQRISKLGHTALEPGMILSNEPGFYAAGRYGIRIENLVLVTEPSVPPGGEREMLGFETLTLAPVDRRLILTDLMTPAEIAWLDGYHARVYGALSGEVDGAVRAFLEAATRPIVG